MEEPLRYHRTFGLDAGQLDELEARIEDILPDPQTSGSWRCETVKCSAEPLISPSKEVSYMAT